MNHTCKLWIAILPSDGQSFGGRELLMIKAASVFSVQYCLIRSTQITVVSSELKFHTSFDRLPLRFNPYIMANPAKPVEKPPQVLKCTVLDCHCNFII